MKTRVDAFSRLPSIFLYLSYVSLVWAASALTGRAGGPPTAQQRSEDLFLDIFLLKELREWWSQRGWRDRYEGRAPGNHLFAAIGPGPHQWAGKGAEHFPTGRLLPLGPVLPAAFKVYQQLEIVVSRRQHLLGTASHSGLDLYILIESHSSRQVNERRRWRTCRINFCWPNATEEDR